MLNTRQLTRTITLAVLLSLPAFLTVGCSDIEVGSAWAPQTAARPSLGSTFVWASEADPAVNDLQGVQPALRDLARQTIEGGFVAKGYQKGSVQQADFWLQARVATAVRGDARSSQTFEQYTEGTLVIYIVNPASGEWIWRGWGNARLNEGNSPDEKRERLQKAVQLILKDLPGAGRPAAAK